MNTKKLVAGFMVLAATAAMVFSTVVIDQNSQIERDDVCVGGKCKKK